MIDRIISAHPWLRGAVAVIGTLAAFVVVLWVLEWAMREKHERRRQ